MSSCNTGKCHIKASGHPIKFGLDCARAQPDGASQVPGTVGDTGPVVSRWQVVPLLGETGSSRQPSGRHIRTASSGGRGGRRSGRVRAHTSARYWASATSRTIMIARECRYLVAETACVYVCVYVCEGMDAVAADPAQSLRGLVCVLHNHIMTPFLNTS